MTVSSHVPQRLQGGQAVLNYRVLRELGSRSAPIYAAHHVDAGRTELSVLQHFRRMRDAVSQLSGILRDARAVAEMTHPNLMRVHSAEPVGEEIVVASEFVEGESLSGLRALAIAQNTKLSLEVQLRIVLEVLAGAGALHDTRDARRRPIGLYHGLLSPAEVLVGLDGVVRVTGVFHALPLRIPPEARPFLPYFAPEILSADRGVDRRADIYSAGAMLWEALAGKRLFADMTEAQILARHAEGSLPAPTLDADGAWAAPLVDVALRALKADPKARFDTAEEMIAAIQPHAKGAAQSAVATLVRQLAGEKILERRGEFAEPAREHEREPDDEDPSVTAAMVQRASGVERRGDDTVTTTVGGDAARPPPDDDSEDSVTKQAPSPTTKPQLPDDSVTAVAPPVVVPPSPPSSSAARPITPAAGAPAVPSSREPPTPQVPAEPDDLDDDMTEAVVTEIRAALPSEAEELDDSVTAMAPVPEEVRARSRPEAKDEPEADNTDTVRRDTNKVSAVVRRSSSDEEGLDDEAVTAIAPVVPVLPAKGDDSVTQNRAPVPNETAARGASAPSAAPFPAPTDLPGPSSFPPRAPHSSRRSAIVEVQQITDEDAMGATLQAMPDQPILMPEGSQADIFLAPPSYKRLGIALGLALVAALALLVYVIIRAATQDEVSATIVQETRVKAPHGVAANNPEEGLGRKGTQPPPRGSNRGGPPPRPPGRR